MALNIALGTSQSTQEVKKLFSRCFKPQIKAEIDYFFNSWILRLSPKVNLVFGDLLENGRV